MKPHITQNSAHHIENKVNNIKPMHPTIQTRFSLKAFSEHLSSDSTKSPAVKSLWKQIKETLPESILFADWITQSQLDKYKNEIEHLLISAFQPSIQEKTRTALLIPFTIAPLFCTNACQQLFENNHFLTAFHQNSNPELVEHQIINKAYLQIFKRFYVPNFELDTEVVLQATDKNNQLETYFKANLNTQFVNIRHKGPLPKLSSKQIAFFEDHPEDLKTWHKLLPIENFSFEGFVTTSFHDITEIESRSLIKTDLLTRETIIHKDKFNRLRRKLRSLLRLPSLSIGLSAFNDQRASPTHYGQIWNSIIPENKYRCEDYKDSQYDLMVQTGKTILIDDLLELKAPTQIEHSLINNGFRNLCIIPLSENSRIIGVLELATPYPKTLSPPILKKTHEIVPLFTLAITRASEELNTQIQALIKEECTAIHPIVEWRFEEAAARLLEQQQKGEIGPMEEIVFPGVYPLYAATDIRNSSLERNSAIQQDLKNQLKMAKAVLTTAFQSNPLPVYQQLTYKISQLSKSLMHELHGGIESEILEFIETKIKPLFEHLENQNPALNTAVNRYQKALHPDLGVVYQKREAFEMCLGKINEVINNIIETEEARAQQQYPFYFEKYRTDGIEYNIYLGASLTQNQSFDPIYLHNLRLWQLLLLVKIAQATHQLKPQLHIPLETTHLVLVHPTPLSIRFRPDEKHFDVDGAYNIRYEIVKKRIDKARIIGTGERLTQPGKIAIVFSQHEIEQEYEQYLNYMLSEGLLTNEIEHLELENLQGVNGLHALRTTIKLNPNNAVVKDLMQIYKSPLANGLHTSS